VWHVSGTFLARFRVQDSCTRSFDHVCELQDVSFRVTCANDSSLNVVTIEPSGLVIDISPIEREVDGLIVGAEVADLDADSSPEINVYISSAGSGSYGSLVAYAANDNQSLSEIYLPPLTEESEISKGNMGHDEFAVVETTFVRRFPVYREGDVNPDPIGGSRQLQYRLEPGEAGWTLRLDKRQDFEE